MGKENTSKTPKATVAAVSSLIVKRRKFLIVISAFCLLGGTLFVQNSTANTYGTTIEAESGIRSGNQGPGLTQGASGSSVKFGANATPTPTPTPPAPTPTPPSPAPSGPIPATAKLLWSGDYNNGNLSQWTTLQTTDRNASPGTYCTYSACVVNDGPGHETAARFEVRNGDVPDFGGGERSEVAAHMAAALTQSGDERWYEWSMKAPSGFTNPNNSWYIVIQWHAGSGSPPMAISISDSGQVFINPGDDQVRSNLVIGTVKPGQWVKYVLHTKFGSSTSTGWVEAWENGVQKIQRTGYKNLASGENYLKQGIYRDNGGGTSAILHDDFRIYEP